MHDRRLVDGRAADLLLEAWALAPLEGRQFDRAAGFRGAVERADDAHVGKPFLGTRLGVVASQHAIREVQQLRRELVALRETPLARLAVQREAVLERSGVFVGRLQHEVAFRADQPVLRYLAGAEAARKGGQALVRKAQ